MITFASYKFFGLGDMGQRGMEATRAINSGKSSVSSLLRCMKLIFVTLVWLVERYTTSGMTTVVSNPPPHLLAVADELLLVVVINWYFS
jgi:hypothetical protein